MTIRGYLIKVGEKERIKGKLLDYLVKRKDVDVFGSLSVYRIGTSTLWISDRGVTNMGTAQHYDYIIISDKEEKTIEEVKVMLEKGLGKILEERD